MIGWLANLLMWFGSYSVGEKRRYGFVCQLVGNGLWAYIGAFGKAEESRAALIGVSVVFCCLYAVNFWKWGKK